jgi:DNA invertase Pin-like site-specific DNA recombinase
MKTIEPVYTIEPTSAAAWQPAPKIRPTATAHASTKIRGHHLERLALVYIRQSSPQQVAENRESTARQYALVDRAFDFGWPRTQIEVIDDDLGLSGKSVEGRLGFQRLLAEVSLDHVGLILGLEISRLARSNRDWHQLLELCGVFHTLLADQDGLYDPCDYNDRLLLGIKGTLREAELHILKGRMNEGKLNKARRGELIHHVPIGYVKSAGGEIMLDPDEQVRTVVHLVFEKFRELASVSGLLAYLVRHGIRLGIRAHAGSKRGQLEWRRPSRSTLTSMLHHPMYAGAYSYGRSQSDARRQIPGRAGTGRRRMPLGEWHVLLQGMLPAYITWEQFQNNQRQMEQNRSVADQMGAARDGTSLLTGLLICAKCGSRMHVSYNARDHHHRYVCQRRKLDFGEELCQTFAGKVVDDLVSRQVLQVLEPASIELSLHATEDIQKERDRLHTNWKQRLERVRFETDRAARQYHAVEPENRLVARELERRWDDLLQQQRTLELDYERFCREEPPLITEDDRKRVRSLSGEIPTLWASSSFKEREQIIRHLVDHVVVAVPNNAEYVDVTIHWAGGFISQCEVIRPVGRYEQLRDFKQLRARILELHDACHSAPEIAKILNRERFRPAQRRTTFNDTTVQQLLHRFGRIGICNRKPCALPDEDEWWIPNLSVELGIPQSTIHSWICRGWLRARRVPGGRGRWICWADADERQRLRRLYACPRGRDIHQPYPQELTTPKDRRG